MLFRVEDASESQQLELSFHLGILDVCPGHIIPTGSGIIWDSLTRQAG